jgi:hypothetical protein
MENQIKIKVENMKLTKMHYAVIVVALVVVLLLLDYTNVVDLGIL